MARLPGFEPGAFRLGGGPSILLRYKRIGSAVQTDSVCFFGQGRHSPRLNGQSILNIVHDTRAFVNRKPHHLWYFPPVWICAAR